MFNSGFEFGIGVITAIASVFIIPPIAKAVLILVWLILRSLWTGCLLSAAGTIFIIFSGPLSRNEWIMLVCLFAIEMFSVWRIDVAEKKAMMVERDY